MRTAFTILKPVVGVLMLVATMFGTRASSHAQQPDAVAISVRGHHFQPAEIRAPANRSLVLRVKNLDATLWNSRVCHSGSRRWLPPAAKASSTFVRLHQVGTSLLATSIERPEGP